MLTDAFRTIHFLAFLRHLERLGGGYRIRGAPGWATADEVAVATGISCSDQDLAVMERNGDLIRVMVRLPGATSPLLAYRIPDSVARLTAQLESRVHIGIKQPTWNRQLHAVTRELTMAKFTRQPNRTLAVLGIMRDLAEQGHGYVALGVPGWARVGDVKALLDVFYGARYAGVAGEELRAGSRSGSYDVIDASVKGATRSVFMYRVTDEAARTLNQRDKRKHITITTPGKPPEAAVWMPDTAPIALRELVLAADNPIDHDHVPGESAWRTSLDLTHRLRARVDADLKAREQAGQPEVLGEQDPSFTPDNLRWLASAGFAEQRREGRKVLFRVTPAGRHAHPLEWRGPAPWFMKRPD